MTALLKRPTLPLVLTIALAAAMAGPAEAQVAERAAAVGAARRRGRIVVEVNLTHGACSSTPRHGQVFLH